MTFSSLSSLKARAPRPHLVSILTHMLAARLGFWRSWLGVFDAPSLFVVLLSLASDEGARASGRTVGKVTYAGDGQTVSARGLVHHHANDEQHGGSRKA